ncbi:hypothetical protein Tsp_08485, partial [Trichinella spiralis]|uniref:hypothetical protein n=1 Tax=Trichinella spiralis TaxID=6334 RepID=UPI0001EFB959
MGRSEEASSEAERRCEPTCGPQLAAIAYGQKIFQIVKWPEVVELITQPWTPPTTADKNQVIPAWEWNPTRSGPVLAE